jgi:hypothetical protein
MGRRRDTHRSEVRTVRPRLLRCRRPTLARCSQRGSRGGIVLSKAPQRRLAVRRGALIGLLQAELLEIAQFANCEIDTHVTTKALWRELVKRVWIFARGSKTPLTGSPAARKQARIVRIWHNSPDALGSCKPAFANRHDRGGIISHDRASRPDFCGCGLSDGCGYPWTERDLSRHQMKLRGTEAPPFFL